MLVASCRRQLRCAPSLGLLRYSSTAQATREQIPNNPAATPKPAFPEDDPPAKALTGTELAIYWDTFAPSRKQLAHAEAFFRNPPTAELLTTTPTFINLPRAPVPEVVFLGRSNVGKSSLLNALMGVKDLCRTSRRPGFTKSMNMYLVGNDQFGFNPRKRDPYPAKKKDESLEEGVEEKRSKMTKREWEQKKMVELLNKQADRAARAKLVVMDMPGYGHASRGEWGVEIEKYLRGRRELKRAFLLINAEYGVKQTDLKMLEILRDSQVPHQIVLSKVDTLLPKVKSEKALRQSHVAELRAMLEQRAEELKPLIQPPPSQGIPALGELIAVSATSEPKNPYRVLGVPENRYYLGIGALRWAVLSAAGLENVKNS